MNPVPFVNSLRSRDEIVVIGEPVGDNVLHLRVEIPEVWDVVRIDAQPAEPIRAIKVNALHALCPKTLFPDDYVIKLGGREIFDESMSVTEAGAKNGSIFLVTHRRRRPVR
ncbi:MAG: hypothetical protein ACR2GG_11220 [Gemmatimonadaceae bacterium]